ncbi:hypothetical+protein [Methylocapsa aurea]|uniref:hypothetical protein n=1 Tax=Methylocapsa aurea TaxID=663610 RepID=UPI003D18AEB8
MPKIIDCSIGFNETDMLRIRRAELASVVDAFVVVESEKSYAGERNPILLSGQPRSAGLFSSLIFGGGFTIPLTTDV